MKRRPSPLIRIYGRMIGLYPADVRTASGQDMTDLFEDLLQESQGKNRLERIFFVVQAFADLLSGCWKARRKQSWQGLPTASDSPPFDKIGSHLMLGHDLRFTVRQLRRSPGFALVTILSLAVGIGATSAIFSAINSIVLRPPQGVQDPQRLVSVFTGTPGERLYGLNSLPDFEEFSRIPALQSAAAFTLDLLDLSREGSRKTLLAESVSGSYFQVLGMRPALGRGFLADETKVGDAHRVTLISHSLWVGEFAQDPSVLGRTVLINEQPFVIVGVAAPGFVSRVLSLKADLWVPLGIPGMVSEEVQPKDFSNRRSRQFNVIARLAPEASLEQAQAQLKVMAERLRSTHPAEWQDESGEPLQLTVADTDNGMPPKARKAAAAVLTTLMVPVGLVLLIACSNVANMLLARATRRHREMALRLALGAGRARLVSQLLMESFLLAVAGGSLGIGIAHYASQQLNRLQLYGIPFPVDIALDWRVLAFVLAASLAGGAFFGLIPALRASRPDLVPALKREYSEGSVRLRRFSLRNFLVVVQVAGSFAMLAGSMLFLRSQQAAGQVDMGFDPENIVTARLNLLLDQSERTAEAKLQQLTALRQRLQQRPEIESVSLAGSLPLSLVQRSAEVRAEGFQPDPQESREVGFNVVTPGYFDLMRISIAAGRTLQAGDTLSSTPVALVNRPLANRFWPTENPIGKTLQFGDSRQTLQVVGVVRDHKLRFLNEEQPPHVWIPLAQHPDQPFLMVLARTHGAEGPALALLSQEVEELMGRPPLLAPAPLRDMIDISLLPNRLASSFLGVTGALALFLALVGLHGVVAYTVSLRTREMGIRMAVGAAKSSVIGLVIRQALSLTGVGFLIGAPLAMAFGALASHLLYGISPFDPLTFGAVALALSTAAALASFVPAMRAASVDPVQTLRFE